MMRDAAKTAVRAMVRRIAPEQTRVDDLLRPVSPVFGRERGTPVDRYYIEQFLEQNRQQIRGDVLEVAERTYSQRFGSAITSSSVLHIDPAHPEVTLSVDLTQPATVPERRFDCFICTQTLSFLTDPAAAFISCHRLLKPGGTLLATVSGISQVSRFDMDKWGDYWRFTSMSLNMLAGRAFGPGPVKVQTYGNVLAAKAVLDGLSVEDLPDPSYLDRHDRDFQVILSLTARKMDDA